ncbi:MAG: YdcF family protein [Sneathiella sp.]
MVVEIVEYYVIFGARVLPDGSPSGSLKRRVEGAFRAASNNHQAIFIPSGGIGKHGPAEAEVITDMLLTAGIPRTRIKQDLEATDTFDTVINAIQIIENTRKDCRIIVCSSGYHNPRCAMLFRLLGYSVFVPTMPSDRKQLGVRKWLYYCLREIAAFLWDGYLMLRRRRNLLKTIVRSGKLDNG